MKVEKTEYQEDILMSGDRKITLYKNSRMVAFYQGNEGPGFRIEELEKILPQLREAVDENRFKPFQSYKLITFDGTCFAIKRSDGRFRSNGGWEYANSDLFSRAFAEALLEQLENGEKE